jgi:hypothetical protein
MQPDWRTLLPVTGLNHIFFALFTLFQGGVRVLLALDNHRCYSLQQPLRVQSTSTTVLSSLRLTIACRIAVHPAYTFKIQLQLAYGLEPMSQ